MRGIKIGTSALILSLILSSMMTFAVLPASADTIAARLKAPAILNPDKAPGASINVDILVSGIIATVTGEAVGTGNGTQRWFVLANKPVESGTEKMYLDGAITTDYAIAYITGGAANITFTTAPAMGVIITADYSYRVAVRNLWSFSFELYYDTSVLTATSLAFTRPTFKTALPSGIDDSIGKVWMGATAAVGASGLTTNDWVPIATVTFSIDARGYSDLNLENTELKDKDLVIIAHSVKDGWFDNRYQAVLSVDTIIDTTLVPTPEHTYVMVAIYVAEVQKLWGVQGILDFDPAILSATGLMIKHSPIKATWAFEYDNTEGWVSFAVSCPIGDWVGLTTFAPKKVVTLEFEVVGLGITMLDLHDTALANVYGAKLVHPVYDGGFVNIAMAPGVALDTLFVETRRFLLSKDDDGFQTLTAQIKNPIEEVGTTTARAHFIIYDTSLVPFKELYSDEVYISPGMTMRLPVKLDASKVPYIPGAYIVEVEVQYLDATLNWTNGRKGSASGARSTMVKSFSVGY